MTRFFAFFGAIASLALAGCTTTQQLAPPTVADMAAYKLGGGDQLRVIIYGEDKLSGEYRVNDSGIVTMPLIGRIEADKLTVDELSEKIAQAYQTRGFVKAPKVAVEVESYRPFFVLGEVNRPGQYPFIPGMSVRQAIATANGYTYRAMQSEVRITHWGSTEEKVYRLDPGAMVAPGDTIRIPERHL